MDHKIIMALCVWMMLPGMAFAAPCGAQMEFLSHPPMADMNVISGISPLGKTAGPDHIYPTHINYFDAHVDDDNQPLFPGSTVVVPGNLMVTAISWNKANGEGVDDWHIDFRPCDEVRFAIHHLASISHPQLSARAQEIKSGINAWCHIENNETVFCAGAVDTQVQGGETLGTAVWPGTIGINFITWDTRDPNPNQFITPSRYVLEYEELPAVMNDPDTGIPPALYNEITPSRLDGRCTLDYYPAEIAAAMIDKLGNYDGTIPSTATPKCGNISMDIAGTAQGGWFPPEAADSAWLFNEAIGIALVPDYVTPAANLFSIGHELITDAPSDAISFVREKNGLINREFKAVDAVGRTFCWQRLLQHLPGRDPNDSLQGFAPVDGVIIARLNSPTEMDIEYKAQESSCDKSSMLFTENKKTVVR